MHAICIILVWVYFVILFTFAQDALNADYLEHSLVALGIIYYFNSLTIIRVSPQLFIIYLLVPSFIFWYVFITYNYFLRVYPFPEENVYFIMFFYFYILIYLFSELTYKGKHISSLQIFIFWCFFILVFYLFFFFTLHYLVTFLYWYNYFRLPLKINYFR